MSHYIMYGYGVKNVDSFFKDEYKDADVCDLIDELDGNDHGKLVCYYGPDIGYAAGIGLNYPYEKPMFESREECDNFIFNTLKPLLRDDVAIENLDIDEFSDYEIG